MARVTDAEEVGGDLRLTASLTDDDVGGGGFDEFLPVAAELVERYWVACGGAALDSDETQDLVDLLEEFFGERRP